MLSLLHRLLAVAVALVADSGFAAAGDSVWIAQVSVASASSAVRSAAPVVAPKGLFDEQLAAGRAFRPSAATPNFERFAVSVDPIDRRVRQDGAGNWAVGTLAAIQSSVQIDQSGFGNGIGIQQDGSGHTLIAIQMDHGNEMLLSQSGEGQRLIVTQSVQQNALSLQQSGSTNVITAVQAGTMNVMGIAQSGSGNRIAAYQR